MCKCISALVGGREWRSLTLLWWYIPNLISSIVVHVLLGCLRFVIVVFPDHTHLLFLVLVQDIAQLCI